MSAGGVSWAADTGTTGGRTWSTGSPADIAGTSADPVYRSERVGAFRYELPVPAASEYLVRLHFAEIWFGAPGGGAGGRGSQIFSVDLEGASAELVDLDLVASVPPMTAVVKELRVRVIDGRLSIATSAKVDLAKLSAVEVLGVPETAPVTAPAPTAQVSAFGPGQGRPFANGTAYNTPLPASPVLDPGTALMVAVIARNGRPDANLYDFGDPAFDGDSSSPYYTVRCTMPWELAIRRPDRSGSPPRLSPSLMLLLSSVGGCG